MPRQHPPRPPNLLSRIIRQLRRMLVALILAATVLTLATGSASATLATPAPVPSPAVSSGASPSPSPQVTWIPPTPTTPPATPSTGVDACGWMDVGCKLNQAMNGWFTRLVVDAVQPAFVLVGSALLSAPTPLMLDRVRELSGHVRLVANALLVLMVLAAGVIVMAYGSAQASTTPAEVIPRLVVAVVALNASLTLCQYAIDLANAIVTALLGDGVDGQRAGNLIAAKVDGLIKDPQDTLLFLVLLIGVAVLMGFLLAFIAIIRIALLLFLIIAAPLALLCHALPQTEGIAKLWWRCFTGLLAIQILQALALVLAFKLFLTDPPAAYPLAPADPGLAEATQAMLRPTAHRAMDALIMIGILFVLIKIPGWVAKTIWQQGQPHLLKRLVKAAIVYKTLGAARALGSAGHAAARRGAAQAAHRHGGPPPRGRPGGPRGPRGGGPSDPGPHPPPTTPTGATPVSNRTPTAQQLELPLDLPPRTPHSPTPEAAAAAARRDRRGHQLVLPFQVPRVPRPPRAPAPASGPWVRPRPPWVQDRLPGMPTRAPRPGQLRLRLDPPPRRTPRTSRQSGQEGR